MSDDFSSSWSGACNIYCNIWYCVTIYSRNFITLSFFLLTVAVRLGLAQTGSCHTMLAKFLPPIPQSNGKKLRVEDTFSWDGH